MLRSKIFGLGLSVSVGWSLVSCGGSAGSGGQTASPAVDAAPMVETFVQAVVIPTYQELALRSVALESAVQDFVANPDEARYVTAKTRWAEARVPWEQSEAFLFGPVDSYGYDPALDSWPLDHGGLNLAIAAYSPSLSLDATDPNLKGFHAIEFLLFGYERKKTLSSFTAQELAYLKALTANHRSVTEKIRDAWQVGIEGQTAFSQALLTAGTPDNSLYPSATAALQELLEGMVGIADEVANNKIAQPYNQVDPNLIESQFSFNSLADFQDNVWSIRNVYLGSRDGSLAPQSISAYMAVKNPALDLKLREQIEAAHASLQAIPGNFRDAILNPSAHASIEAAQEALRTLQKTLDQDLRRELFL